MNHAVKTRYLASFSPPYNTIESSLFCVSVRAFVCLEFRLFHSCSAIFMSSVVFRIFSDIYFLCGFFFYFNCLLLDYWCLVYFCNTFFLSVAVHLTFGHHIYVKATWNICLCNQVLQLQISCQQKVTWTFLDLWDSRSSSVINPALE